MLKTAESPCITEGKYGNQLEKIEEGGCWGLELNFLGFRTEENF